MASFCSQCIRLKTVLQKSLSFSDDIIDFLIYECLGVEEYLYITNEFTFTPDLILPKYSKNKNKAITRFQNTLYSLLYRFVTKSKELENVLDADTFEVNIEFEYMDIQNKSSPYQLVRTVNPKDYSCKTVFKNRGWSFLYYVHETVKYGNPKEIHHTRKDIREIVDMILQNLNSNITSKIIVDNFNKNNSTQITRKINSLKLNFHMEIIACESETLEKTNTALEKVYTELSSMIDKDYKHQNYCTIRTHDSFAIVPSSHQDLET
jgi:hypothetical protein